MFILDGTFPRASRCPRNAFYQQFGVSRGSIRDAFRMLETIGPARNADEARHVSLELTVDRLVAPLASMMTFQQDLQVRTSGCPSDV